MKHYSRIVAGLLSAIMLISSAGYCAVADNETAGTVSTEQTVSAAASRLIHMMSFPFPARQRPKASMPRSSSNSRMLRTVVYIFRVRTEPVR